jgi:hypothetical protein
MVRGFQEARKTMKHQVAETRRRKTTEFVRVGKYATEVPVELIHEEGGWAPYLSVEDVEKLEQVREALQRGDLAAAAKYGRVFELTPVSAQ